jgi:hypothetical protein
MPSVPRIVRAVPRGPVTRPDRGIPVMARLHWHHGEESDIPALATAWTRDAVEITWELPGGGLRSDWIPAADVARAGRPGRGTGPGGPATGPGGPATGPGGPATGPGGPATGPGGSGPATGPRRPQSFRGP